MKNEQDTLILVLGLPPSINAYYGYTAPAKHKVIKYVKEQGKAYLLAVKKYVKTNGFDIQANIPLKVEVLVNFPTNHITDLDNRMKCLLDALTLAEVWEDDSLINDLHIVRGSVGKPGGVIVKITEYK